MLCDKFLWHSVRHLVKHYERVHQDTSNYYVIRFNNIFPVHMFDYLHRKIHSYTVNVRH